MGNINNPLIEEYIRDLIPKRCKLLEKMEFHAETSHIPIVQPEVAQFLKVITKIKKPEKILEIGTAIGYSAIIFSSALDNGFLYTIERRKDMIELANSYIKESGLESRIKILNGDAEDILPTIKEKFDLIFLDAAKGRYLDFFNESLKLLNNEGIIISDNVLYKGMIASDKYVVRRKKTIVKRMRTYLDHIMNHPQLTTCVIPIGDGIALSYKRQEEI